MAEMPTGALERTLYLRSLPAFDGLRSTELAVIAQLMRERRCARGTVLYERRIGNDHILFYVRTKKERQKR